MSAADHPLAAGLPDIWPELLGYNRLTARPEATTVARRATIRCSSPGSTGEGRVVAFASDCGPHWAPPAFVEWDGLRHALAEHRQLGGWIAGG